ncbi:MAG: asparagine synthase (glutamine-hydrolyzing) [Pyrinomonadaceae bacterium]
MCGIAGILSPKKKIDLELLKRMTDAIAHRGPDGDGFWVDQDSKVGLGHRRLAVIDLTETGKQPMSHANGRYALTFNGEIYNYIELRQQLEERGHNFVSTSDTEVLLALFHEKKERALDELDGMFAFAIWDKVEQRLFIARDRFGEKPFYFAVHDGSFYFASEMKALWAGGIARDVSTPMLFNYLSRGFTYDPSNLAATFFVGIYKLKAGCFAFLTPTDLTVRPQRYWGIDTDSVDADISEEIALAKFRELFDSSVARRLRSDVPVGSSLSGGLDSSLIVCTIDRLIKEKDLHQATFSARFPGFAKDEGQYMQAVIDATAVEPHFVYPDEQGLIEDLEKLCHHQEEPFSTASIYAQYCVMRLAKENDVTVLLDGQGADELLAGYNTFFDHYFRELKRRDPKMYRLETAAYARMYGDRGVDFKKTVKKWLPDRMVRGMTDAKRSLKDPSRSYLSKEFYEENRRWAFASGATADDLQESLYQYAFGGPLEELLRYADRNSMAHSREVRLPFLSHHLAEFVFSLPPNFKIRNGVTKYIMRAAYSDTLPPKIVARTDKVGYEPPQGQWMRHPRLLDMIGDAASTLERRKIVKPDTAQSVRTIDENSTIFNSRNWKLLMAAALIKG